VALIFKAAKLWPGTKKNRISSFDQKEGVMKSSKGNKEERNWGRRAAFYLLKDLN